MFGHKTILINLPFTRSRKSKDVEIVRAEIQLLNSVPVYRMSLELVDRLCRGRVHRDV